MFCSRRWCFLFTTLSRSGYNHIFNIHVSKHSSITGHSSRVLYKIQQRSGTLQLETFVVTLSSYRRPTWRCALIYAEFYICVHLSDKLLEEFNAILTAYFVILSLSNNKVWYNGSSYRRKINDNVKIEIVLENGD